MKDENGRDIKLGLEEARRIMATDYCVRSDLALCGEFFNEYGMLPQEYIKEYDNEAKAWEGLFDSPKEAVRDLKNSYNHAEKVNAYIVITD